MTSPTAASTAIADAARQATDLAMVAGTLAVWDPNRPDQVHLARVGAGVVCTVLRGTPADRQPGGHLPLGVDWCWEPAADNPPNCRACLLGTADDGKRLLSVTARRLITNLTSSTR